MADLGTIDFGTFDATNSTVTGITGSDPVLEVIASAADGDYVYDSANNGTTVVAYLDVGTIPADFDSMTTVSIRLRTLQSAVDTDKTWDTIQAQILTAWNGTALTDQVTVESNITHTTPTNTSVIALTTPTGSKADWDGAVLELTWTKTKIMGGGSQQFRVTAGELTGTYAQGTVNDTASPDEVAVTATIDRPKAGQAFAIALVCSSASPTDPNETEFKAWLETLGHTVTYVDDAAAEVLTTDGYDIAIIHEAASSASLGAKYDGEAGNALPVIHANGSNWDDCGYVANPPTATNITSYEWETDSVFLVPGFTPASNYTLAGTTTGGTSAYVAAADIGSGVAILKDGAAALRLYGIAYDVGVAKDDTGTVGVRVVLLGLHAGTWDDADRTADQETWWHAAIQWIGETLAVNDTASPDAVVVTATHHAVTAKAGSKAEPATLAVTATHHAATASEGDHADPAVLAVTTTIPASDAVAHAQVNVLAVAVTVTIPQATASAGVIHDSTSPAVVTVTVGHPAVSAKAGSTASPATLAVAVGHPAVAASGSDTASPDPVAVTVAHPAATPAAGSTASPDEVAVAVAVPAPAAKAGSTASPDEVAVTVTVPAATASGNDTGSPDPVAVVVTHPAVSAAAGSTASPDTVAVTVGLPAVSATPQAGGGDSTSPDPVAITVGHPAATPAAGSTASPDEVAVAAVVPAADAKAGSTASPGVLAVSAAIPAATAAAGSTASPDEVSVSVTIPAVTASGSDTASPGVVAVTVAIPAATPAAGSTASPATLAVTTTIPQATATATAGDDSTSPDPVAVTVTIPAATPAAGSTASPAEVAVTATIPAVAASGSAQANPATVPVTLALPAPTLAAGSTATPDPVAVVAAVLRAYAVNFHALRRVTSRAKGKDAGQSTHGGDETDVESFEPTLTVTSSRGRFSTTSRDGRA